ncbi:GNAT family N-acetyltransferase [Rhodoplanes sp. Z2-YC6860]|uniref:GNAT family N-acetyltransferase n=1 Tax=Rhodoplanes sp. Z2-YC6860 TaxID=674703 RepID=UPI00078BD486|nr:GNAT family N-acetyltransferase [Rhodoplanes sp. Z2-YC6860]AMN43415.1 N-acetyltransferase GCN5 [Rhodoplanes sp. Z2-YC6860]
MAHTEPIIDAPLSAAERPDAEALVREAGWNQVPADWEIFLALGTIHAARVGARVVATAATLPYGEFAWISLVLVNGEYRRHGLGTRLLKRCIEQLKSRGCIPVLDATPAGQPLYRGLGFQETWSYRRLVRQAALSEAAIAVPNDGTRVRPITNADWTSLCAYDSAAFGANRSALLGRMRGRLPAAELIAERHGRIVGFSLGRDGRSASQIGPIVAEDDAAALALLAEALPALSGPVFVDLADAKTAVGRALAACGFTAQRPLTRMLLGRSQGFDDPARTFAVAGPEIG